LFRSPLTCPADILSRKQERRILIFICPLSCKAGEGWGEGAFPVSSLSCLSGILSLRERGKLKKIVKFEIILY
jgi:hypothetical protein